MIQIIDKKLTTFLPYLTINFDFETMIQTEFHGGMIPAQFTEIDEIEMADPLTSLET